MNILNNTTKTKNKKKDLVEVLVQVKEKHQEEV